MLTRLRCCCTDTGIIAACFTVQQCGGSPVSGATVTVTQGGVTVGTCTTDIAGECCVILSEDGDYNASVSMTGHASSNKDFTTPVTGRIGLTLEPTTHAQVLTVNGCSGPLQGVTVSCDGGSYTTDSSGNVYLSLPIGTHGFTASYPPEYQSASGSITVSTCTGGAPNITLDVSDGYVCLTGFSCVDFDDNIPLPRTLNGTDSAYGGFTAVYDDTVGYHTATVGGVSVPGGCPLPPNSPCANASNVTLTYNFFGNIKVDYTTQNAFFPHCARDATFAGSSWAATVTDSISCSNRPFFWTQHFPTCGSTDAAALYHSGATLTLSA